MQVLKISSVVFAATMFLATGVYAQDTAKQDMKDAGHATKDAAKDTGHATKVAAKGLKTQGLAQGRHNCLGPKLALCEMNACRWHSV